MEIKRHVFRTLEDEFKAKMHTVELKQQALDSISTYNSIHKEMKEHVHFLEKKNTERIP